MTLALLSTKVNSLMLMSTSPLWRAPTMPFQDSKRPLTLFELVGEPHLPSGLLSTVMEKFSCL